VTGTRTEGSGASGARGGDGMRPPPRLTDADLLEAVAELGVRDDALRAVTARFGPPPMWDRKPGFATLVHLILEQQVSIASARAAFERLADAIGVVTPDAFLALDAAALLAIGFSRQKARYARALAEAVREGRLDLDGLDALDDADVDAALTALPGIGPWTATLYRLEILLRPDAWPIHDIALAQAYAEVKGLAARPSPAELDRLAEGWVPYRAVAARILWHHYLSVRAERRAARGG
jgi:DNA-3-methyladenine glycosylase II